MTGTMDDRDYMKMALALAEKGRGFTSPNPMVGAVLVRNDQVIGKGWHQMAGKAHAEVNAIADAGDAANGSTLYVTLEPCNHTGQTPPCTHLILDAGIRRVVAAMPDPNPDVTGGGLAFLKEKGVEAVSGICESRAIRQNETFIKYIRTKQPFVILKNASTLDGRIATRSGDSKWVTGDESRRFVHQLRHEVDAIMVGINTIKTDNPRLTTRLEAFKGRDPIRIILDTRLSIPESAKLLQLSSDSDTVIVCGNFISEDKKRRIEKKGIKILKSDEKDNWIDLKALMPCLGKMGVTSLLVEGGSRVTAAMLTAGVVDKVFFFYAPKILGGDDGIPICSGPGPLSLDQSIKVKNVSVRRFADDVMIEGYIDNPAS